MKAPKIYHHLQFFLFFPHHHHHHHSHHIHLHHQLSTHQTLLFTLPSNIIISSFLFLPLSLQLDLTIRWSSAANNIIIFIIIFIFTVFSIIIINCHRKLQQHFDHFAVENWLSLLVWHCFILFVKSLVYLIIFFFHFIFTFVINCASTHLDGVQFKLFHLQQQFDNNQQSLISIDLSLQQLTSMLITNMDPH